MYCIYMVLTMSDSLSPVRGHLVHYIALQCFQQYNLKKANAPTFLIQFQLNFM